MTARIIKESLTASLQICALGNSACLHGRWHWYKILCDQSSPAAFGNHMMKVRHLLQLQSVQGVVVWANFSEKASTVNASQKIQDHADQHFNKHLTASSLPRIILSST